MIKILGKYILQPIEEEYVLFPSANTKCGYSGICSFNETGAYIWQSIEARCTPGEISSRLCERYGIDSDTARRDTNAFLSELESICVISK